MTMFAIGAAVVLNVCSIITYICSEKTIRQHGSYWKIFGIYALIALLAAVAVRYYQQERPDELVYGAILKFTASLPTVLYALKGWQTRKTRFGLYILIAIVLGLIADVTINISFVAGSGFFLVGHLLYDFAFQNDQKPSFKQVILWLVLTALMGIPVYLFREKIGSLLNCIGALAYVSILISTIVFSFKLDKMIFAAAVIFALSDCFMIFNIVMNSSTLLKILALLVYYGSLLLYGAVLWKRASAG